MADKVTKKVALALSSGGPRGFAYIGAIEELESRGYTITSVAGTSIGSLIGGIYAAGKLNEVKDWLFSLDAWNVFSLVDVSLSNNHLVKGDKVIEALKEIVPEINIENLNIPYKCVAADLHTGEEVIFDRGPLFQGIRASISIPSLFRPVKYGYRTLIDGGIVNTLPLNRVTRIPGDILVGFDVNDIDVDAIRKLVIDNARAEEEKLAQEERDKKKKRTIIESIRYNDTLSVGEKIRLAGMYSRDVIASAIKGDDNNTSEFDIGDSYYSILSRTFSLMNHIIAKYEAELYKPDVLAKMPFDAFDNISDYARAREISELGRELMSNALDKYESVSR